MEKYVVYDKYQSTILDDGELHVWLEDGSLEEGDIVCLVTRKFKVVAEKTKLYMTGVDE